jgi:hypothetical protein
MREGREGWGLFSPPFFFTIDKSMVVVVWWRTAAPSVRGRRRAVLPYGRRREGPWCWWWCVVWCVGDGVVGVEVRVESERGRRRVVVCEGVSVCCDGLVWWGSMRE